MKRIVVILTTLLLTCAMYGQGQGSFCGAVGTPGCTAIKYDSAAIIGWATGCTVERGPVDIIDPDGPRVHFGDEGFGVGPATTATTSAVSLGDGGTATLTFAEPIRNVAGPDFAVFENSFDDNFLELAFVEVSTDGERYVRFPSTSLTPTTTQVVSNVNPTNLNNLAGKYRVGYGTPFDLEELKDSAGIDINNIVYVRLVDVVGTIDPQYATYDAYGHMVNDPYPTNDTIWASGGFDLTGVAVLQASAGIAGIASAVRVMAWPNPTTGWITVIGVAGHEAELCDLRGRRLGSWRLTGERTRIDLTDLPAGVYLLRVEGKVTKVVKH